MSLPVAHGLLGAIVVAASIWAVSVKRDWRLLSAGAALAILPDFDYFFYLGLGLGEAWHRTFTHSILFALFTGVVAAALLNPPRPRMALVYFLATMSHSILDVLTSSNRGGVEVFWPFYTGRIHCGLVAYRELVGPAPQPLMPVLIQLLTTSAVEFAVFAPIFIAVIWINRSLTNSFDS